MKKNSSIGIVLLLLVYIPTLSSAADWPMFRHDAAHSGVAGESVEPPLELLWKYRTDGRIYSSPVVSEGVVYVGSEDSYVYALDASTGSLKWKYKTGSYVYSSPAISGGIIYVGSFDNQVYALDASTGSLKWKYGTSDPIGSPTVSDGVAYIGSWDSYVYALDASTGNLKWKYKTGYAVGSSPAVSGGVVYIGSWDSYVYAMDANTGNLKWKYGTANPVVSSPAVSGDIVYVGSGDGYVYALDSSTGSLKWKYKTSNWIESSPAISGNIVYVGSNDSYVYAMDASTGSLKWKYKTGSDVRSSPAVSKSIVYVGSYDYYVYAIDDSTGSLKWKYRTDGIVNSPIVSGGVVYVGSGDGNIYAFAPASTPTTGTISVSSTPSGASIYLDGSYQGKTPKTIPDVSASSHYIELKLDGYNLWSDSVDVAAGGTSYVSAPLIFITPTPTKTSIPVATTSSATPPSPKQTNWVMIGGIGALIFLVIIAITKLRTKRGEYEPEIIPNTTVSSSFPETGVTDTSKKSPSKKPESKGTLDVKSAYEYKGAKIYYKIKIENNAIEPVGDIKVHLFVPEVFLLSEKEKAISMLEPKESKTITFEIRPTGECGDCNVSGKVEYYDYTTKGRKMLDIENKSLSVICPVLKRKEIDLQQWERVMDELIKAEENIKELSAPAENLFNITSRVIKDNGMFMLKPEITSTPSLFNGIAMFYAEGVTGYRYAAYMEVVGGARKSRMILKVWAEKDEALIGFYHRILDDIEKRIDVKIFIDDTIVQQHIHIGDKIGTQVKDSVVQRSNIGAGARKCPECGREVDANEKFCPECGARL